MSSSHSSKDKDGKKRKSKGSKGKSSRSWSIFDTGTDLSWLVPAAAAASSVDALSTSSQLSFSPSSTSPIKQQPLQKRPRRPQTEVTVISDSDEPDNAVGTFDRVLVSQLPTTQTQTHWSTTPPTLSLSVTGNDDDDSDDFELDYDVDVLTQIQSQQRRDSDHAWPTIDDDDDDDIDADRSGGGENRSGDELGGTDSSAAIWARGPPSLPSTQVAPPSPRALSTPLPLPQSSQPRATSSSPPLPLSSLSPSSSSSTAAPRPRARRSVQPLPPRVSSPSHASHASLSPPPPSLVPLSSPASRGSAVSGSLASLHVDSEQPRHLERPSQSLSSPLRSTGRRASEPTKQSTQPVITPKTEPEPEPLLETTRRSRSTRADPPPRRTSAQKRGREPSTSPTRRRTRTSKSSATAAIVPFPSHRLPDPLMIDESTRPSRKRAHRNTFAQPLLVFDTRDGHDRSNDDTCDDQENHQPPPRLATYYGSRNALLADVPRLASARYALAARPNGYLVGPYRVVPARIVDPETYRATDAFRADWVHEVTELFECGQVTALEDLIAAAHGADARLGENDEGDRLPAANKQTSGTKDDDDDKYYDDDEGDDRVLAVKTVRLSVVAMDPADVGTPADDPSRRVVLSSVPADRSRRFDAQRDSRRSTRKRKAGGSSGPGAEPSYTLYPSIEDAAAAMGRSVRELKDAAFTGRPLINKKENKRAPTVRVDCDLWATTTVISRRLKAAVADRSANMESPSSDDDDNGNEVKMRRKQVQEDDQYVGDGAAAILSCGHPVWIARQGVARAYASVRDAAMHMDMDPHTLADALVSKPPTSETYRRQSGFQPSARQGGRIFKNGADAKSSMWCGFVDVDTIEELLRGGIPMDH
ncbi:hypothetical protein BC828DRAFT_405807 [Blastocladiella britannica]|nr:hypothetical protein BC828DRAFT_405807 [Blastocladiella britannica]